MEMEKLLERISSWFNGRPAPPMKVDVFLTQRCNLKCNFCNFPLLKKNSFENELSKEELLEIVQSARDMDAKVFSILGGEPFYRRNDILDVMKAIKENGMAGSIVTNGTLFNDDMIRTLVEIEWDLIRFSIDGSREVHDRLRGAEGVYNRAVDAMKKFKELKKELKKNKPTIEINTVLCKENYKEIIKIIELAHRLDCRHMYVLPMIEFTEASKKLKIREDDTPEVRKHLEEARRMAEKLNLSTNLRDIIEKEMVTKANKMDKIILPPEKLDDKDYIPCFIPWYAINIDAHGIMTPCSQFDPKDGIDIKQKSLNEIWYGEAFNKIRKNMKNKKLPECCKRCCVPLVEENEIIRGRLSSVR